MPTRVHAKMLISQLERAESVVKDLFLEATDDGIEALEAVLAACRKEVLAKGPRVPDSFDGDDMASESQHGGRSRESAGASRTAEAGDVGDDEDM